jgi:hypothetical protein
MKSSVANMGGLCFSLWNSVKTAGKAEVLISDPEVETLGNAENLARRSGLRHPSRVVSIGTCGQGDAFQSRPGRHE